MRELCPFPERNKFICSTEQKNEKGTFLEKNRTPRDEKSIRERNKGFWFFYEKEQKFKWTILILECQLLAFCNIAHLVMFSWSNGVLFLRPEMGQELLFCLAENDRWQIPRETDKGVRAFLFNSGPIGWMCLFIFELEEGVFGWPKTDRG